MVPEQNAAAQALQSLQSDIKPQYADGGAVIPYKEWVNLVREYGKQAKVKLSEKTPQNYEKLKALSKNTTHSGQKVVNN